RPDDVPIVNLRPRAGQRCGDLDAIWKHFETSDLGALGRVILCGRCPRRPGCFWPRQYGKRLRGSRVVFATQAHFERSPNFVAQVGQWTGAKKILTILDESKFLMTCFQRRISRFHLERFIDVLERLNPDGLGSAHRDWLT